MIVTGMPLPIRRIQWSTVLLCRAIKALLSWSPSRTPDHSLDGDLYHTALRVESSVDPSVVVEETWNTVTVHAEKPNFVRPSQLQRRSASPRRAVPT